MSTPVNKIVIHKVSNNLDQERINLLRRVIEPRLLLTEINDAISVYIHPRRIAISGREDSPAVEVSYNRGSCDRYDYPDYTISINLVQALRELEDTIIPQIETSKIKDKLGLVYSILRDNIIDKLINYINK